MRAVRLHRTGGPDVLRVEEVPVPKPGPGEALVRLQAASLNHLDVWLREGALPVALPHTPGSDGAGEVAAVGPGVAHLHAGERCLISPVRSCGHCARCAAGAAHLCDAFHVFGTAEPGTYAEYVAVPADALVPIPVDLPWAEAACVGVAGLTAWHMLVTRAALGPGETVLVHSAGSGVGMFAVQIGRLAGARVITTVGDDAKVDKARVLGADAVIHHGREDFAERVRELTGGRGADVVLDHVGAAFFSANLECLARGGRLVVCGTTTGGDVAFHLRELFAGQQSILGVRLGSPGELRRVAALVAEGRIRPLVDAAFPLERAADAHARMASRALFGKIVLTLS
jgi:NADPH:quinone reductase-like Zn-dependent oxidoreductase